MILAAKSGLSRSETLRERIRSALGVSTSRWLSEVETSRWLSGVETSRWLSGVEATTHRSPT